MIATDTPVTLGRMRECGVDPVELQNLVDNLRQHGQSCQPSSGKHVYTRDTMKLAADGRPAARQRGYTVRWEKAARRFLAKHPTCARFGSIPSAEVWPQRWITL